MTRTQLVPRLLWSVNFLDQLFGGDDYYEISKFSVLEMKAEKRISPNLWHLRGR
jgi:hypothetical protein